MLPDRLSPQQTELLHRLAEHPRGIPEAELDGRSVRALVARGLAERNDDLVRITAATRNGLDGIAQPEQAKPLTDGQQDLLRRLDRSSGPLPSEELDGRRVRALIARGLAIQIGETTAISSAGREYLQKEQSKTQSGRKRGRPRREDPRAKVILNAVRTLEHAIPHDSELAVGRMFVHVDDLLDSFRKLARRRSQRP